MSSNQRSRTGGVAGTILAAVSGISQVNHTPADPGMEIQHWSVWPKPRLRSAVGRAARRTAVTGTLALGVCSSPLAQDRTSKPPVHITKGRSLPTALVGDFRERVHEAVQRNNRYVETWQVPTHQGLPLAGTWRKTWCELSDVAIEMRSSEVGSSPVVAIVTGRAHSDVARALPSDDAAQRTSRVRDREIASDGRFALLYVHVEADWRRTLSQFWPELNVAPEISHGLSEIQWQDLWSGGPGTEQQDFCVVAEIWRRLYVER